MAVFFIAVLAFDAHAANVTGHVIVTSNTKVSRRATSKFQTAVWLEPHDRSAVPMPPPRRGVELVQKNKQFEPRLLVIPVGTAVEFPNRDPFFHNVFSLFDGKRFDLGLYEAGASRTVHFDRPGVSYIFCNIHSEMSAVVIAVDTPYSAVADASGTVSFADVLPGRYQLHVWHEGSSPEALDAAVRDITIAADDTTLGAITVVQDQPVMAHKNKYGRDYEEPAKPGYEPQ